MTSLEFYTDNFEPQDLLDSNSKINFVFYVHINSYVNRRIQTDYHASSKMCSVHNLPYN